MLNKILNIFRKKDSRKIPLIHVHTFKTGEKLYTYSQENYGAIAPRYYKAVNIALNYITMYNADEQTVKAFFDKMLSSNNSQLELLYQCKKSFSIAVIDEIISLVLANRTLIEFQKAYIFDKTSMHLIYQEMLFKMFYLLDDEIEGGYNIALNEKKMELINKDETQRDVFFSSVNTIAENLGISFENVTQQVLIKTIKLQEMQLQSIQ